jgi:hypothetical protein
MGRITAWLGLALCVQAVAGCGSNQKPTPKLVSLAIDCPQGVALGLTTQCLAQGRFSDGSSQDVTSHVQWLSSDEDVLTVSAGALHPVAQGSTVLQVVSGTMHAQTDIDVGPPALVGITVTPGNPQVANGLSQQFTAVGQFSDGSSADITEFAAWTTSDAHLAVVSGGLAQGVAIGSVQVNALYLGVMGSTDLTISTAVLTELQITPFSPTLAKGTERKLVATGLFSDGSASDVTSQVTFSVLDPSVATVTGATVTAVGEGRTEVVGHLGAASGSTLLGVTNAAVERIELAPSSMTLAKGTSVQLTATGDFSDQTTQDLTPQVAFSSRNSDVAQVTAAGVVTAIKPGTATLVASYGGVSAMVDVTVTAAQLHSVNLNYGPAVAAPRGTLLQFTATAVYSDNTTQDLTTQATWTASNASAATVSSAGLAQALALGASTITATYAGLTATTVVTVTSATLTHIQITAPGAQVARGTTLALIATGTFSDGSMQTLTDSAVWASSNISVAVVSNVVGSKGVVTGAGIGGTTITAAFGGVTGSLTIAGSAAAVTSLRLIPNLVSVPVGLTQAFSVRATLSDGTSQDVTQQASFDSADAQLATVSNTPATLGVATGRALGAVTITATVAGVSGSAQLTVTTAQPMSLTIMPGPAITVPKGLPQALHAIATLSDGSTVDLSSTVMWSSTQTTIATVSKQGVAQTTTNIGSTVITAVLGTLTAQVTLTTGAATKVGVQIAPGATVPAGNPPLSMHVGERAQLQSLEIDSAGGAVDVTERSAFASSSATTANVVTGFLANTGLVTALAAGMTTITTTVDSFSATAAVNVMPANMTGIVIKSSKPSLSLDWNEPLQVTATYADGVTADVTGTCTFTSNASAVADFVAPVPGMLTTTHTLVGGMAPVTVTATSVTGLTATLALVVDSSLPKPIGLTLTPTTPVLLQGSQQRFLAEAMLSNNTTANVTKNVVWTATAGSLVISNLPSGPQGTATALAVGAASVSASLGSDAFTASANVTIH